MTERVMVLGAGGHAKVVIDVLRAAGHDVVAVFDDDPARQGQTFRDAPVMGMTDVAASWAIAAGVGHFIVAIGQNAARLRLGQRLEAAGLRPLAAVHPSAVLAPSVVVGGGTVVMAGVCINADSRLGRHVIINTGARIDHDCLIGDGAHVAPGAVLCGNVQVGELAFLGAGTVVIPGIGLGAGAAAGAGSVVVRPVQENQKVRGVPARPAME